MQNFVKKMTIWQPIYIGPNFMIAPIIALDVMLKPKYEYAFINLLVGLDTSKADINTHFLMKQLKELGLYIIHHKYNLI